MGHPNIELGKKGEEIAADYLISKDYKILETNYRYGHGEIDIIAQINESLVFVEVKTRKNKSFGETIYSVTPAKLKQINKIAELYLYEKELVSCECRIDAITIDVTKNGSFKIEHYENIS